MDFELSNFSVYLPSSAAHHRFEFRPLQDLATKSGHSYFLFDGILSAGSLRRYVQAVPFQVCSIGNYGADTHGVGDDIWIQSDFNANSDVYYRLKSPAAEYSRFYTGFKWLADLAKHFVDFCQFLSENGQEASIHSFRKDFSQWVQENHAGSPNFKAWYSKYESHDFRRAVATNINFLFKESVGVDDSLRSHPIWSEVKEKDFIPYQNSKVSETIVTPYVYECFKHLRFGHLLKAITPSQNALERCTSQGIDLDLKSADTTSQPVVNTPVPHTTKAGNHTRALSKGTEQNAADLDTQVARKTLLKAIKIGDVLSIAEDGTGSGWKDEVSRWKAISTCWYLLVQGVHEAKNRRSFAGIWFYIPAETSCGLMKYPHANELFLSNNCTCFDGHMPEERVLDVVKVSWNGHPSKSPHDLFVRQTWLDNERFVTLRDAHKQCEHIRSHDNGATEQERFPIGQTVLSLPSSRKPKHALEPCVVMKYSKEGSRVMVTLRRLLRRAELDGQSGCRPNELVYTDQTYQLEAKKVTRTCLVRCYTHNEAKREIIPTPYDRDGTGNAFFITRRLVERETGSELVPISENFPKSMIEGFNPLEPMTRKKLRGLDLYCGGGNFGRGLEEGGVLHHAYAVDIGKTQIHTYYANLKNPKATKLYYGSVDDQLLQALQGNPIGSDLVPLPGDIDFVSAGSPCQGFSNLNPLKNNDKGLKNQSLVASVAAYADFYRPKYGILENVIHMAQTGKCRDEDVLSQLICALVGLGYQLQVFLIDAWSCGSPQSRSRLFVSFAAPGYVPLQHPEMSHSHPPKTADRGLGKMANGEPFGHRLRDPTPFEFVSSGAATADLPDIGDGLPHQCISHPDHIVPIGLSDTLRRQIVAIPIQPRGSNFVAAWSNGKGTMTQEQRNLFPFTTKTGKIRQGVDRDSNAWGRVNPRSLFQTIVVSQSPADAKMGRTLHWDQHRPLTVMEARRAQGFIDNEVLLGRPSERWHICGNSVARTVSLALGLSLREAWLSNPTKENDQDRADLEQKNIGSEVAKADPKESDVNGRLPGRASRQVGNLALNSALPNQKEGRATESKVQSQKTSNGRKRHFDTLPDWTPRKAQKLSSPESPNSPSMGSRPGTSGVRPQVVLRQETIGKVDYLADTDNDGDDDYIEDDADAEEEEDDYDELDDQMKAPKPRIKKLGRSGSSRHHTNGAKMSSMSEKRLVIDLTRDSEQDTRVTNGFAVNPVNRAAPPNQYLPAGNNSFISAYAQTHRTINGDKFRKHGPKSTW
jgi:DNA (cytosine-5)-methyltransferase 1